MTKILWADDQEDVVKTFSNLLASLKPKLVFSESGERALHKLSVEHFDILLLDLMMPPGRWGGLWLLEEIRKAKIRIPVIVLSGEGTQSETIKALRLGAKDYVTKDNIETELLSSVQRVIHNYRTEVEDSIIHQIPILLALPYKRYLNTVNATSQLRRLIEFYEATLRLCCIIGVCELQQLEVEKALPSQLVKSVVSGPSMGTWNRLRHALAKKLPQDTSFFQLHHSLNNKTVNSVIRLRNDISHGAEPSERMATEHLDEYSDELQNLIYELWQNLRFRIVIPASLHFDGVKFQVHGKSLMGDNVSLPKFSTESFNPIVCDQPYLINESSPQNSWVNLYPFIVAEPAKEPNTWNILIFDSIKVNPSSIKLVGDEPMRYINLWSGVRNIMPVISKPTSSALPKFLVQYSQDFD